MRVIPPEERPTIGEFIYVIWRHWGPLMSGAFSVPFAALAVFVDSAYGRFLWGLMAIAAFLTSSYLIWARERKTVIELREAIRPKIRVVYDENEPSCNSIISFSDGTKSRCIRLKVENTGTTQLQGCEGWCIIDRFPLAGSFRLIWAGASKPGTVPGITGDVDLVKAVPRFVQVFRIRKSNHVIPATEGEVWLLDEQNKFVPGDYQFDVILKGMDEADTVFYSLKLNWTGDWQTTKIIDLTKQTNS